MTEKNQRESKSRPMPFVQVSNLLRRMAHVATRHSSQFVPPHNPVSQAQVNPLR
jgi:hypothetical protein